MPKSPNTVRVTELRQGTAAALKRVRATRRPLVITQRGRPAAVMVSVESYRRAEHERQILLLLAHGEREIHRGKGFDLDTVLDELDQILAEP